MVPASPPESSPGDLLGLEAPGRAVLVVEDEPVLRASMVRGLSKLADIEVVDAGNLRDARKLIRAYQPRLLIADIDLPDGSGIELAAELDRCGLRIPIIFASAFVGDYRGRLPQRAGIQVLEKPITLDRLRGLVGDQLGAPSGLASSPFGVADYVQLAGMGRRSVVIEVRGGLAGRGRIVIRSGEVWSADDELGGGMAAFRRLAFLHDAQVSCSSLRPGLIGEHNVEGACECVLLEAARQLDEASLDDGPESAITQVRTRPDALEIDAAWEEAVDSPPRARSFDELYERGVDALLEKDYRAAYAAFVEASRVRPDDTKVNTNLTRLRILGYGE